MKTNLKTEKTDTLDDTFALFFGETEETAGTGTVIRADKHGILRDVVVDAAERADFFAAERAKSDARNAEIDARHAAEAAYYPEEG